MRQNLEHIPFADLQEFFEYLDGLRESGIANMFGAPAYLQAEYGILKPDSNAVVMAWVESYDETRPAVDRLHEYMESD